MFIRSCCHAREKRTPSTKENAPSDIKNASVTMGTPSDASYANAVIAAKTSHVAASPFKAERCRFTAYTICAALWRV